MLKTILLVTVISLSLIKSAMAVTIDPATFLAMENDKSNYIVTVINGNDQTVATYTTVNHNMCVTLAKINLAAKIDDEQTVHDYFKTHKFGGIITPSRSDTVNSKVHCTNDQTEDDVEFVGETFVVN